MLDNDTHKTDFITKSDSDFNDNFLSFEKNQNTQNPSLPDDIDFLVNYQYETKDLFNIAKKASENSVDAHLQLIYEGKITEARYYRCLAEHLNVAYRQEDDIARIEYSDEKGLIESLRSRPKLFSRNLINNQLEIITSPNKDEITDLKQHLGRSRNLHRNVAIATPETLKSVFLKKFDQTLTAHTSHGLRRVLPSYSAYSVTAISMMTLTVLLICTSLVLSFLSTSWLTMSFNLTLAFLFLGAITMRFLAALTLFQNKKAIKHIVDAKPDELPIYSVLVALYDEAIIIPDLVSSLDQLKWPKAKLDIKIILEETDEQTIIAVEKAIKNYPQMEMLIVPDGEPRTKPRALNYALTLARGSLITIYDAEDRPHPNQLFAAYSCFQKGEDKIACVQAPLLIDNANHNWLSTMFSLEYSGLFDGLIPFLTHWNLPVLLGGTSNHFKTDILRSIGAWDPFNVTEDADLGIRLKRLGYGVDVIDEPTYEEAPSQGIIWLKQRTRWFKGWMQTVLVHMRSPHHTLQQLGLKGFSSFHFIASSLVISALGYPFFLIIALIQIGLVFWFETDQTFILLNGALFLFSYATYIFLTYRALSYRQSIKPAIYAFTFPAYWLFLSFAAWRALLQLIRDPHKWEKTPHGKEARRRTPWHQK